MDQSRIQEKVTKDIAYLFLLVVSTIIFTVFFCPYLESHRLGWVCIGFYVVVVFTFLLGRSAVVARRRRGR